jgi:hypothetical protein
LGLLFCFFSSQLQLLFAAVVLWQHPRPPQRYYQGVVGLCSCPWMATSVASQTEEIPTILVGTGGIQEFVGMTRVVLRDLDHFDSLLGRKRRVFFSEEGLDFSLFFNTLA